MKALTGGDTERSALSLSFKENTTMCSDNETIMSVLRRHEKMLNDIQKQMRSKINKADFTAGLSSKVSLSDITNITMDLNSEESIRMNQSNTIMLQSLQEQLTLKTAEFQLKQSNLEEIVRREVNSLRKDLKELEKEVEAKMEAFERKMIEREKPLRDIFEKKAERSEIDKVLNLSGLLAIEFEQIRKRFASFETESSLVWKEISNIYQNQTTLKKDISQTKAVKEEIQSFDLKQKKRKALFPLEHADQQNISEFTQIGIEEMVEMRKKIGEMKQSTQDHDYSLKLFGERLGVVQNYHETWFKSLKEIEKTRKEAKQSLEEAEQLHSGQSKMKEQCISLIKERVKDELRVQSGSIKAQIKQACCELTDKMLTIFQKCAKTQDLHHTTDMMDQLQEVVDQKIKNLAIVVKKNQEQNSIRNEVTEEKMRVMQRDIESRLKKEEFKEQRGQLITSNEAVTLLKKTETGLKKEFDQFASQQKVVNEVLCSQNVLTRWAWTSGTLKGGNLVSWDRELVNTLPQNFLYSKDEQCFRVISGGIYRFELGFYSKKKPTIQIIVNGQTIISAVNSNSYVVHHSSGKLKDICINEVSGLTYIDFFTLQENSRIAIAYCGELGHGFIGLQRM